MDPPRSYLNIELCLGKHGNYHFPSFLRTCLLSFYIIFCHFRGNFRHFLRKVSGKQKGTPDPRIQLFLRPEDDLLLVATFLRATLYILSDKRQLKTIDASSLTYRIKYACICVHPVRLFLNRISGHNTYLHPNKIRM